MKFKILVTGGAGFIGSHVVDAYIEQGHDVIVVDDLSSGKLENLNPKARFYKTDIRSEEIHGIFEREKPDILNHHAAQISVPASVSDPAFDADVNIKGFLNLLEAARKNSVKKVIFASTGGAIYGEAAEYPTPETCAPSPLSPYAITKSASENYLAFYNHQYGLDYTVLRYSNVYGPRQIPHGEAGVMAIFMKNLLSGKPSTVYYYPDEPRGMTRDYCYAGDVSRANVLALGKSNNGVFNIGTGVPTHTLDLFNLIYKSLKEQMPEIKDSLANPGKGPVRPGDIKRSCLNVNKAEKLLGWKAKWSLEQGVEQTVKWCKEQG